MSLTSACQLFEPVEVQPAESCAEDEFVQGGECVSCPPGTRRGAGDVPSMDDTACDMVSVDEARSCGTDQHVVDEECRPCAPGSTNVAGDRTDEGDTDCAVTLCNTNEHVRDHRCFACPEGLERASGDPATGPDTVCSSEVCLENEYVDSGRCKPCMPGWRNDAGDPTDGRDTTCSPWFCAADERVEANRCVPCDPGAQNEADDPATGPNTTCESILCELNQRVADHRCEACPPGSVREAGDDATGQDTTCTPTACSANEHVIDHQCTPCPQDTLRDAGDLATGGDTACDLLTQISAAGDATCALKGGEVWCWGSNASGVVAPGSLMIVSYETPTKVPLPGQATALYMGGQETACAVVDDKLTCWGAWHTSAAIEARAPFDVGFSGSIAHVTLGAGHLCVLDTAGDLFCRGRNDAGQVGVGGTTFVDTFERVEPPDGDRVVEVSAGDDFTCAFTSTSDLYCWGASAFGQLGLGSSQLPNAPATQRAPLTTTYETKFSSNEHYLATGSRHACLFISEGHRIASGQCWGDNTLGALGLATGTTPSSLRSPPEQTEDYWEWTLYTFRQHIHVAQGSHHQCLYGIIEEDRQKNLKKDPVAYGDVVTCFGGDTHRQTGRQSGAASVFDDDLFVRLSDHIPLQNVYQVAAGRAHTCAVQYDGEISCWGSNALNQLGQSSITVDECPDKAGSCSSKALLVEFP